jgi:hypothetical protein
LPPQTGTLLTRPTTQVYEYNIETEEVKYIEKHKITSKLPVNNDGNSKVVFKEHILVEKSNKAAYVIEIMTYFWLIKDYITI